MMSTVLRMTAAQRFVGAADPWMRAQSKDREHRVGQDERIRIEDPAPDHRHQDGRVDQRQIEQRTVEDLTSGRQRLKQTGDQQCQGDLGSNHDERVQHRITDGFEEDRVARERDEVLQADEGAANDARVLQRQRERLDHRNHGEQHEERERRSDEDVRPGVFTRENGQGTSLRLLTRGGPDRKRVPPGKSMLAARGVPSGEIRAYLLASSTSDWAWGAISSRASLGAFLPSRTASAAGRSSFWSISDQVRTFGSTKVKLPMPATLALAGWYAA